MPAYFTSTVRFENGFTDASDTGWVNLNSVVKYRYKNGYVTVAGASYSDVTLSPGEYTHVGTLPSGYRPAFQIPIAFHTLGGDPTAQSGFVGSDGIVDLYTGVTTGYWAFSVTYPI
jgi:hypothetical protein